MGLIIDIAIGYKEFVFNAYFYITKQTNIVPSDASSVIGQIVL